MGDVLCGMLISGVVICWHVMHGELASAEVTGFATHSVIPPRIARPVRLTAAFPDRSGLSPLSFLRFAVITDASTTFARL